MTGKSQSNSDNILVGYSALNLYDDCYEYNENACYIADSPQSLRNFLAGAMLSAEDYSIEPVRISDILRNFGCSYGEYALEPKALGRFVGVAKSSGINYTVKEYEDIFPNIEPKLFIVNLEEPKQMSLDPEEDESFLASQLEPEEQAPVPHADVVANPKRKSDKKKAKKKRKMAKASRKKNRR